MAEVARRVPDAVCVIAGRGELLQSLQQEAAAVGVAERVKLLGFRSDVPDLLALFDVFALPSLSEGLPLSLLEAQAAGAPIVATAVGGNPEAIEADVTGFLVPPGRPEALAERVTWLLERPAEAAAMGARGRVRARERFSVERMGRRYLELFGAGAAPRATKEVGVSEFLATRVP
jgi:glycosyltransferase involved in cell wall biosynthesis